MIFVVGSSGGGGPKAEDAILTVTAPYGATVTATKNGISLTPTIWITADDATKECALFVIAPAQFDATTPWTVTATSGTKTKSDTILIDGNAQYDMTLGFDYWLIKHGVLVETFTKSNFANLTQSTDFMLMSVTGNNYGRITTQSAVDFTEFSTLKIVFMLDSNGKYGQSWKGGTYYPSIGYGATAPSGDTTPNFTNYELLNSTTGVITNETYTLNITSQTGSKFISVLISGSSGLSAYANIYDLYLEQ